MSGASNSHALRLVDAAIAAWICGFLWLLIRWEDVYFFFGNAGAISNRLLRRSTAITADGALRQVTSGLTLDSSGFIIFAPGALAFVDIASL
jgi:hypothetical protein